MRQCVLAAIFLGVLAAPAGAETQAWSGFANSPQHTGLAPAKAQPMTSLHWTARVDAAPVLTGGELLIHYGSPMITAANTVVVPTRISATTGFRLQAYAGATGVRLWLIETDWTPPPSDWTPPLPAALGPDGSVYVAGAGGTILRRTSADSTTGQITRLAFMGRSTYDAHKAAYNASVMVSTPITVDQNGTIYFGFCVEGTAPGGLTSGWARIAADGTAEVTTAIAATGDAGVTDIAMNAAPALSRSGGLVYVAAVGGNGPYLVGLNGPSFKPNYKTALTDPSSGLPALLFTESSASPMVAPDGDVYYGTIEDPFPDHNDRGWLLHFDAHLATVKTPGSFGWDNTPTVLPAAALKSYTGKAKYLLVSKYNNYYGIGTGDGMNRVALLDPTTTEADPVLPSVTVMGEVETVLSPEQFPGNPPGARYEWCIDAAVVDAHTASVIVNSEDGVVYRWDLATNTLAEHFTLNPPLPEAYTPTLIGPDGTIYAINNARLYAIGK